MAAPTITPDALKNNSSKISEFLTESKVPPELIRSLIRDGHLGAEDTQAITDRLTNIQSEIDAVAAALRQTPAPTGAELQRLTEKQAHLAAQKKATTELQAALTTLGGPGLYVTGRSWDGSTSTFKDKGSLDDVRSGTKVLEKGAGGIPVGVMQDLMIRAGIMPEKMPNGMPSNDRRFGPFTEEHLKKWQAENGIYGPGDANYGKFDKKTIEEMEKRVGARELLQAEKKPEATLLDTAIRTHAKDFDSIKFLNELKAKYPTEFHRLGKEDMDGLVKLASTKNGRDVLWGGNFNFLKAFNDAPQSVQQAGLAALLKYSNNPTAMAVIKETMIKNSDSEGLRFARLSPEVLAKRFANPPIANIAANLDAVITQNYADLPMSHQREVWKAFQKHPTDTGWNQGLGGIISRPNFTEMSAHPQLQTVQMDVIRSWTQLNQAGRSELFNLIDSPAFKNADREGKLNKLAELKQRHPA